MAGLGSGFLQLEMDLESPSHFAQFVSALFKRAEGSFHVHSLSELNRDRVKVAPIHGDVETMHRF